MKRSGSTVSLVCVVMLGLGAGPARAFDGGRQGFLLGFGVGAGLLDAPNYSVGQGNSGVQTDLKIGHGISEQWQVFYTGKQYWRYSDGGFMTGGFPALGTAYYLKAMPPSAFVTGGAGAWLMGAGAAGFGAGLSVIGPGMFLGVGYEMARHISLELDASTCAPAAPGGRFINVALTLNLIGY